MTKSRWMLGTIVVLFLLASLLTTARKVKQIESDDRIQPKQLQSGIESRERTQVVQRTFDHQEEGADKQEYKKADSDAETQDVIVAVAISRKRQSSRPTWLRPLGCQSRLFPPGHSPRLRT